MNKKIKKGLVLMSVFDKKGTTKQEDVVNIEKLYSKIGKLEMERDFLKKNLTKLNLLK